MQIIISQNGEETVEYSHTAIFPQQDGTATIVHYNNDRTKTPLGDYPNESHAKAVTSLMILMLRKHGIFVMPSADINISEKYPEILDDDPFDIHKY